MYQVEQKTVVNYVQNNNSPDTVIIDHSTKKTHDYKKAKRLLGEANINELEKFGSICLNGFIYTIVNPYQTMHFCNGKILLPKNYKGVDV